MSRPRDWLLSLDEAARSLRSHPARNVLTMLGVVVGVAAVVVVLAVATATERRVIEQIQSLGGNLLLVLPGSARDAGVRLGAGSRASLTAEDAAAIREQVPGVLHAAPSVYARAQAVRASRNWKTTVQGVGADYLRAREWKVALGRSFTGEELLSASKVALLGATVAAELFPGESPLGAVVRVRGVPLTVIGVLEPKGQTRSGADQDDKLMIPLSTARIRVLGTSRERLRSVQYVMLKVTDPAQLEPISGEVRRLLRQRHGLRAGQPDDFTVKNLAEVQERREEAARTLSFWLTAVASVSLIVGGVSIANMSLVSVSERTREIGLRVALGATPRDIRHLFLAEALLLSLGGGLIGVATGAAIASLASTLAGVPIAVTPGAVVLALLLAVGTGLVAAVYPATSAARMEPIESLRRT